MSQLFNGSICLTDIPKDKITTSEKNGKKYLNITVWLNDDADQYGNIGSLQVSQSKQEREAGEKKQYIGNFKKPQGAAPAPQSNGSESLSDDSLPF